MKTLLEILTLSSDYLKQKGVSQARRQAEDLLCDALKIQRMQLYTEFDRPLLEAELEICRKRLVRRGQGEPSQYIHGQVEFYGCTIKVSPDVLIPRQETEILVDKIIKELSNIDLSEKTFWDVCCGSGCIGIAIKKHFPLLKVEMSDLSPKALAIAKENALLNEVEVSFHQGDLLKPFHGMKTNYFVCNPPYISEEEYKDLDSEVRNFEPRTALLAGNNGLEFYQKISSELPKHLLKGGKAWMEIGHTQGQVIQSLFLQNLWKNSRLEQDWAGKDRFFFLEIE
jgi:release factor glutamine methyltransferase